MKCITPSVRETAFNCPHCGALANQAWYEVHARGKADENPKPLIIIANEEKDFSDIKDQTVITFIEKARQGIPFFEISNDATYTYKEVVNVNISDCFNCKKLAVWIFDRLAYPTLGNAPQANPDLPESIRVDYDEASRILDISPRGAAALVRLCIQKLCKHLGQPGKNINDDIAALVREGLDKRVQMALDAVRVIGNNAVHPGNMDIKDDRATAESLFRLLNLIVERTITEPKHVDEIYASLPAGARAAIEKRDKEVG